MKNYALSSKIKKQILDYFNSIETVLKEKASLPEKWLALNGKTEVVYEFSQALMLQSRRTEEDNVKITEKQLSFYLKEFQKRAKEGKLPRPLLRGSDLLKREPPIKKENFSKILKQSYHNQLTNPKLTKKDLLKKINKL